MTTGQNFVLFHYFDEKSPGNGYQGHPKIYNLPPEKIETLDGIYDGPSHTGAQICGTRIKLTEGETIKVFEKPLEVCAAVGIPITPQMRIAFDPNAVPIASNTFLQATRQVATQGQGSAPSVP